jgi:hypothetical protein
MGVFGEKEKGKEKKGKDGGRVDFHNRVLICLEKQRTYREMQVLERTLFAHKFLAE